MSGEAIETPDGNLRRGTWAVVLCQLVAQAVSLAVLAALFRMLGPRPYGLLGMVLPLLILLRLLASGGFDVAAIQRDQLDRHQVSTLFWLGLLLSVGAAVLTAASAPLLVWFYGLSELGPLTAALAGTLIVTTASVQPLALLQRELLLGRWAVAKLAALLCGGIAAVGAAYAGWGVWALVVQQYVELIVLAAIAWRLVSWRPTRPRFGGGAGELIRFGGDYTLSGLMFFLVANVDKILVGVVLGPVALALYFQAFNLMMRPIHVVITPLTGVMLPALSRAWGDREKYTRLLARYFHFIGLLMPAAGTGLVIVAPETVRLLGGEQWAEAGLLLAVLAPTLCVAGFFNALGSVFASAGRADRLARASIVIATVFCIAFVVGLKLGQHAAKPLLGISLAYTITMTLLVFPVYLAWALHTVGVSWRDVLRPLGRPLLGTVVMGAAVATLHFALAGMPDTVLWCVEVAVGVVVYGWITRRDIHEVLWAREQSRS